jgi:alpha-L-fucosidase
MRVWEACHTLSGSWGYHRDEDTWSAEQLVQMLVGTVAMDGNLLMNVGPTARGTLDHRAIAALPLMRSGWRCTSAASSAASSPISPRRSIAG